LMTNAVGLITTGIRLYAPLWHLEWLRFCMICSGALSCRSYPPVLLCTYERLAEYWLSEHENPVLVSVSSSCCPQMIQFAYCKTASLCSWQPCSCALTSSFSLNSNASVDVFLFTFVWIDDKMYSKFKRLSYDDFCFYFSCFLAGWVSQSLLCLYFPVWTCYIYCGLLLKCVMVIKA
jgi:hypothetical protein